ncbi:cupin domain-containing protein [Streptacidiphilus sp. N1-10]|uniref:Cupin domain-containing protein n=1 Tax=Streptacidiphilus jeojiensis TaxID=3229225 RepID=A0ABV6XNI0_9ACTN
MSELPGPTGLLIATRDIRPAAVPGHSFRVVADGSVTAGAFSLTESESPKGAAVPPHAHDRSVECFYVLDGAYRLTVSGASHEVGPGGFLLVPRGAPHQFEVVEGEARALVLFTPAGFEEVFRQMPAIFGTPGEPGPAWVRANAQAATRLLDGTGPGPAALVRGPDGGRSDPVTLADGGATGTGLRISLHDGDPLGARWAPGPSATAVYVLAGRYRFDLPGASTVVAADEYLSLPQASAAQALALSAGGRALVLHSGE